MVKKEKAKRTIKSAKLRKLMKDIENSPFDFGGSNTTFVPVSGPFSWVPNAEHSTLLTIEEKK